MPIRVVNDCAERSLWQVTDCHIDRTTRSEEQTFHLYQQLPAEIKAEEDSTFKEVNETNELLVLNCEFDHWCFKKLLVAKCFTARYY